MTNKRTYEEKKKLMDADSSKQSTGYTWEEVPEDIKAKATQLAESLDVLPQHAYMMMIENI